MRVIVRQPTGKFGVFDAAIPLFVRDHLDLDGDLSKLEASFRDVSPRLLAAEIAFARDDVSWGLDDWPSHPDGLARWERCLRIMVGRDGVAHTQVLLDEAKLSRFKIPAWILDEDAERRDHKTKSERRRHSNTEV
ncbi:hypothetical protein [Rhizobium leguminosarum]|uniref:hypothetical protein n=1 Tax=Rhizobium leguminosarum TaxID=384 RepID=UPI002E14CCEB|nr:hypothetical protein U8Q02_39635 [Rhizobium leguminosarum]